MIYLLAALAAWLALDALIVWAMHRLTAHRQAEDAAAHRVRGLGVDMAQSRREHEGDDHGCAWRG